MSSLMRLWLAGILALAAFPGWCEDAQEPLRLTPRQAAELALKNSTQLQSDEQAILEARATVEEALSGMGLKLNAQASYTRMGPIASFSVPGPDGPVEVSAGNPTSITAALQASKPLYTGGRVERAVDVTRATAQGAEHRRDANRLALSRDAEDLAYAVLRAARLTEVARAYLRSNEEHLKTAQAMFDAGVVARFEVVQAQTRLASAQGQVIAAYAAAETTKALLRKILTIPQTRALEIVDGEPGPEPAGDLPSLIEYALRNRPEVAADRATVAAAEAAVELARATDALAVTLSGQVARQTASSFSEPTSWSLTLAVTKPLIDSGLRQSRVEQAAARLNAAKLRAESTRQQIALDVTQQYIAVAQARAQVDVARQGVENAREQLRIAQVRFSAGTGTGLEVIDAQTAQAAAETMLVNATSDVEVAVMKLSRAVAQPPAEEGQQ